MKTIKESIKQKRISFLVDVKKHTEQGNVRQLTDLAIKHKVNTGLIGTAIKCGIITKINGVYKWTATKTIEQSAIELWKASMKLQRKQQAKRRMKAPVVRTRREDSENSTIKKLVSVMQLANKYKIPADKLVDFAKDVLK